MIAFHTGINSTLDTHPHEFAYCPNTLLLSHLLIAVHIVAHLFNFEYFMDAQLNRDPNLLPFVLSQVGNGDNRSFLNPIRTNETVSYVTGNTCSGQ